MKKVNSIPTIRSISNSFHIGIENLISFLVGGDFGLNQYKSSTKINEKLYKQIKSYFNFDDLGMYYPTEIISNHLRLVLKKSKSLFQKRSLMLANRQPAKQRKTKEKKIKVNPYKSFEDIKGNDDSKEYSRLGMSYFIESHEDAIKQMGQFFREIQHLEVREPSPLEVLEKLLYGTSSVTEAMQSIFRDSSFAYSHHDNREKEVLIFFFGQGFVDSIYNPNVFEKLHYKSIFNRNGVPDGMSLLYYYDLYKGPKTGFLSSYAYECTQFVLENSSKYSHTSKTLSEGAQLKQNTAQVSLAHIENSNQGAFLTSKEKEVNSREIVTRTYNNKEIAEHGSVFNLEEKQETEDINNSTLHNEIDVQDSTGASSIRAGQNGAGKSRSFKKKTLQNVNVHSILNLIKSNSYATLARIRNRAVKRMNKKLEKSRAIKPYILFKYTVLHLLRKFGSIRRRVPFNKKVFFRRKVRRRLRCLDDVSGDDNHLLNTRFAREFDINDCRILNINLWKRQPQLQKLLKY